MAWCNGFCFILVVLLMHFSLGKAFNNHRTSHHDEEDYKKSRVQSDYYEGPVDEYDNFNMNYDNSRKHERDTKLKKQRHRNRRDHWNHEFDYFRHPFFNQDYMNNYPVQDTYKRNAINMNGYNPYSMQPSQNPNSGPITHNTIVPSGSQYNNFYFPNPPQNQNGFSPFGFPFPFFGGPFIFIPIPVCYPQPPQEPKPQTPTTPAPVSNTESGAVLNVTKENRFAFIDENGVMQVPGGNDVNENNTPLEIDPSSYYNTLTGISLEPVKPLRPPTQEIPPVDHRPSQYDELPRPSGNFEPRPINRRTTQRPQTQRPQTPRATTTVRPFRRLSTTPTTSRTFVNSDDTDSPGVNSCVKAISMCCTSQGMDRNCFLNNDCPILDDDPCTILFNTAENILRRNNRG